MTPSQVSGLERPELYINRDLSWIEFNRRVFEEAQDNRHPLLERVKFLSSFDTNLDEFIMIRLAGLKDQVEARWRDDQITTRLKSKGTEMVQKLEHGGKLSEEATAAGLKVETAPGLRRDASPSGLPAGAIAAAFRTAKDGVGQVAGAGSEEWIVFRVTEVSVPPVDFASDEIKKLKDTLQRGLTDEQVAEYVNKLETDIGTTINQTAFAQVTGANQ